VAEELTGSRFGFICEVNEAGRFDTIAISDPGWQACKIPIAATKTMLYDVPVCGIRSKVYETGEPLLTNDPASHPDFVFPPEGHPPLPAFLGVPLKDNGHTIGLIALGNKPGGYETADQEAIERLALAIVEALQRWRAEDRIKRQTEELARTVLRLQAEMAERQQAEEALRQLNEELELRVKERTADLEKANDLLKKSEEHLRYLASKILTAQEQERKRLAMELHDGLGQSLSALKMYLRAIQRHLPKEADAVREDFEDAHKLLRDTIEETRKISRGLSPALLENLGLTAAVRYLMDEFGKHHNTKITFDTDDIQDLFSPQT
jgi:hypothetical protein